MPATIAIITPTLGRSTLAAALRSGVPQLGPRDEWLIVGDGDRPAGRRLACGMDPRIEYLEHFDPSSHYGNAQRNFAMRRARADCFVFLDDDDVLMPGALDAIRSEADMGAPLMFRMQYRPGQCILWQEPELRVTNVAGPMFVVPNQPGRWADWSDGASAKEGDFEFICRTLERWPAGSLKWCDAIICRCDWHGEGRALPQFGEGVVVHPTANIYGSTIGNGSRVAAFVEIGGATIGARCKIQAFAFIPPGVTIGDEVFIGPHCCFTNDRYPRAVGDWTPEPTIVESGASLGAQCTILPGVRIGVGAIVGAGITVTKDVPPGCTVRHSPW